MLRWSLFLSFFCGWMSACSVAQNSVSVTPVVVDRPWELAYYELQGAIQQVECYVQMPDQPRCLQQTLLWDSSQRLTTILLHNVAKKSAEVFEEEHFSYDTNTGFVSATRTNIETTEQKKWWYNATGNIIKMETKTEDKNIPNYIKYNPYTSEQTYHYTASGKLMYSIKTSNTGEASRKESIVYDTAGRQTLLVICSLDNADDSTETYRTTYEYNDQGLLVTEQRKSSLYETKLRYWYDDNNRLVKEEIIEGSRMTIQIYSYDEQGRMVDKRTQADTNQTTYTGTSYVYDVQGNWIEHTIYHVSAGKKSKQHTIFRRISYY